MKRVFSIFLIILAGLVLLTCEFVPVLELPHDNPADPASPDYVDPDAQTITLLAIGGVTVPVAGAVPVAAVTETEQYTGTVSWSPDNDAFATETVYTATITLTPKTGYILKGVAANSFTVAGADSVTHSVDSGLITAVFPSTYATTTLLAIPGITAPETGFTPVTTAIDTSQYTGTISWSPSHGTFAGSMVYTANIALTAKAGWTLSGVPSDSFTVAGATVTHAADSGSLSAVFPATGVADYDSSTVGILKLVPAGRFQRDATATNISVITRPYRMSQHEITRTQFAAMLTTDPSNATYSSGNDDPVQMTNWYHAIAFCNKLSIAEGLTPVYSVTGVDFSTLTYAAIPTSDDVDWNAATAAWTNNGYRLPTEMEWMWAAMGAPADGQGGSTNTTGYAKAFAGSTGSNSIGDYAVFGFDGSEIGRTTTERTNPAGSKLANELGLHDMSGNVWEWCWDWYADSYPDSEQTEYRGTASGTSRVRRGSTWNFVASYCAVAFRVSSNPYDQNGAIGFRVVRP